MDMTDLVCGGCNRAWDALHERLRPGCPYLSECEWSQLPKASCAHCTGKSLPPGMVEDDFRDYTTQSERLMQRVDWWEEVEESLNGQGTKSTLGHGKKGVRNFWVSAYDLELEPDEEGDS